MARSLAEIVTLHRDGKPVAETIREAYAAIRTWDDPALFITLRPEAESLAAAEMLGTAEAQRLPLIGVPYAVKDNIDVAGLPTTAACPDFTYRPARDAFVVARLNAAGAIPIGKTNLDQFATGLVGVRSPYGTPRNALDGALIPGGSSSGSASAVAAGLVPFALGTDTAGSGRVPAAMQGIVGLKPSPGLLSTTGVVPACRTLDCVSIFARSVADACAVFDVAACFDQADAFARRLPQQPLPARPCLGVPSRVSRRFLGDSAAENAFEAAIETMRSRGEVVEVDFEPFFAVARMLYEGPWVAERYVAVRSLIEAKPEALNPVTRQIIEGARGIDAASAFEAFYRLAELKRQIEPLWQAVDLIVVPTTPTPYTIAEVEREPVAFNSNLGLYTNFANLLDLCALAVPAARRDGKPFGITFMAPAGRDHALGEFAHA